MRARIAPRTEASYASYLKTFRQLSPVPLPLTTSDQACMAVSAFADRSWRYISSLKAAILDYQSLHNMPQSLHNMPPPPWVAPDGQMRTFLKGLKRVAESTPCPGFAGALPLPTSTLNAMVDRWLAQEALASLRNATTASLQFFGIRRSDEVFQSRKSDFKDLGEGGGF